MTDPIDDLLNEREKTHGVYSEQALTAQALKHVMREAPNWGQMPSYMRESLELIATKISRACHGSIIEKDVWVDIAGYSQLVVRELEK
jgi:hypothetical protein